MSAEEEEAILLQMKLQEGRPELTCRFKWEAGSIAMWCEHGLSLSLSRACLGKSHRFSSEMSRCSGCCRDNRCVLHSASGDFWPHRRLMERLTILDHDAERRVPFGPQPLPLNSDGWRAAAKL